MENYISAISKLQKYYNKVLELYCFFFLIAIICFQRANKLLLLLLLLLLLNKLLFFCANAERFE